MAETKCFKDAFRDQLHEFSGQPNIACTRRHVAVDAWGSTITFSSLPHIQRQVFADIDVLLL